MDATVEYEQSADGHDAGKQEPTHNGNCGFANSKELRKRSCPEVKEQVQQDGVIDTAALFADIA